MTTHVLNQPACTIRALTTAEELQRAAEVGQRFYAEGGLPGRLVPEVFTATWQTLLATGRAAIFGLHADDQLVGAIGATIYPDPNDGVPVATELFWYVVPEARGGWGAVRLLRQFETWAREQGAGRLCMVHLQKLAPERLADFYLACGYRPVETAYHKEI